MSQASLPCTSLSARKLKKPNPDWIVFQCWMKTLEHNWTQKILLGVFQNSWYKVVLMDQVIFKYYGRDFTRCGDKLRRIAKEHLWILKRETRQCLILNYMRRFYGSLYSLVIPSYVYVKWRNSLTPLHFWTWKMTNLIINMQVGEKKVLTRPRWCLMMVRLDVW